MNWFIAVEWSIKQECDDQLGIPCLSVGCAVILFCKDKCPYSGNCELILILLLFNSLSFYDQIFKVVAESLISSG
jgi:hypothetical protein